VKMRIPTLLSITIAFSLTLVAASPGEKYKFVAKWGGEAPPGTLNLPGKVAVDADGNIFVADQGNNRIEKFDQTGKFLLQWGKLGSQGGEFSDPSSAAVDASGNVFVADYYNSRIQEFTNNGVFIKAWGGPGSRAGEFELPNDVAVDSNGNVFVADTSNNRIQKFTNQGGFIALWGGQGSGNGQFNGPATLAVGADGYVFVGDGGNSRIQKFTNGGRFVGAWGSAGTGKRQFLGIMYVAADEVTGNVFVTDANFDSFVPGGRVQKFTSDGVFVTSWGGTGSGDGRFNWVSGVAVNATGDTYVADIRNGDV
jgi:tripartite motif-containing protein 71